MRAVDCQGLAGGFTLGTVRAGFDLVSKLELPGGFGMANCEANRHLLGEQWVAQEGPWEEWEPYNDVPYVFGNPPCSGFSLLNTAASYKKKNPELQVRNHRGWDSPINDCMWAMVHYASRVNCGHGPLIFAMESVQQAYKKGRILMQMLRDRLEENTGERYDLHHVLMSGASVGAAQWRRRYFLVLSQIPFAVEHPEPSEPVTYRESIHDLQGLRWDTWDEQEYASLPDTMFQYNHRRADGKVGDHFSPGRNGTKHTTQVYELLESGLWAQGDAMVDALKKFYERHGYMPNGFDEERVLRKEWHLGFHQPRRVPWNKPGYVITGSGGYDFIHPTENRFFTVRECARLQGYPDDWTWSGATSERQAYAWIGKGVPVESGEWLSTQVRRAIDQEWINLRIEAPNEIGEREYLWDKTNAYKGK